MSKPPTGVGALWAAAIDRLSWRVGREPGVSLSNDRASMARMFAYLFGIGANLVFVTLVAPAAHDQNLTGLVAVAAVANITAVGFVVGYDRLPMWLFKIAPGLGSLLIGVLLVSGGATGASAYAMYFFWVTLSAAYFFPLRIAWAHVGFASLVYGVFLLLTPQTPLRLLHWIMATGAFLVAGLLMVRLREHTEQAQADADRAKAEFFALVSHELRTPLTSIIGYLDLARGNGQRPAAEQQSEFLDVIDRNSRRLLRLVGDMLFIAQVQTSGLVELERGELNLTETVRESIEKFGARADREGLNLVGDLADVDRGFGDAERIGQAVDNLISNSIKFTPERGTVTVRLRADEAHRATIEVEDTGMGIREHEQDKLFQNFFRADDARRLAIEGTGLGLSIVKSIVEAHGGNVTVRSRVGEGTTVCLSIPIGRQEPREGRPVLAQERA